MFNLRTSFIRIWSTSFRTTLESWIAVKYERNRKVTSSYVQFMHVIYQDLEHLPQSHSAELYCCKIFFVCAVRHRSRRSRRQVKTETTCSKRKPRGGGLLGCKQKPRGGHPQDTALTLAAGLSSAPEYRREGL